MRVCNSSKTQDVQRLGKGKINLISCKLQYFEGFTLKVLCVNNIFCHFESKISNTI